MVSSQSASTEASAILKRAQFSFSARRFAEAESLCRLALAQDPDDALALKLLVVILFEKGDDAEIESLLTHQLSLRPEHGPSLQGLGQLKARQGDDGAAAIYFYRAAESLPAHAPLFNDLGVSLHRLEQTPEALEAFGRAVELEPEYALAHSNRGMALFDCKRYDEATHALLTALINAPPAPNEARAAILHNLARAAHRAHRLPLIEPVLREEAKADPSSAAAEQLAFLLDISERADEAKAVRNDVARQAGVGWKKAVKSHKATILILGGVGGNHVPTGYLVDGEIFSTLSLSLLSPDQPDAPLGFTDLRALSRADVVFNALGDADIDDGQLRTMGEVCRMLGKPILNPPAKILKTGRDNAAELFKDIPDLIAPATRRTTARKLAENRIEAPVLVRPIGDHGGERLVLLRDEQEKRDYLVRNSAEQLLLTPFHDFRSADGHWRKYRLIFIDREVYPYHLAIGDDWLVHYWRAGMARAEWKKQEEEAFLTDWRTVFGAPAVAAIEDAARRLDLDYCGMDCALTRDGRVLLFEANACMLVHLTEPASAFPYKHHHVPKIREAFSQMVLDKAGIPATPVTAPLKAISVSL